MIFNFIDRLPRRDDVHSSSNKNWICISGLLLCCSLLFSGCLVDFTDPLPGFRGFTADPALLGRWKGTDQQGNPGIIQFDGAGAKQIAVSVFGKDSDLGYKNPIFKLRTTKIGSFNYMILTADDSEARLDYTIARYSIDKNVLRIWIMNLEKVKEAIENGRLKGTVSGNGAIINSPSSEVIRLLNDDGANDLFVCLGEFEKVTK